MKRNEIQDNIKKLSELDAEWEEYFESKFFLDTYVDGAKKEIKKVIQTVFDYCKEKIDAESYDEKILMQFKLPKQAEEMVEKWLDNYAKLRVFNLPEIDGERLLRDIFDKIIVFYDGDFFCESEKYNIESVQVFVNAIVTLDGLVSSEVCRRHDSQVAWKTMSKYFDDKLQSTFMNVYGANYEAIQRSTIIDLIRHQVKE